MRKNEEKNENGPQEMKLSAADLWTSWRQEPGPARTVRVCVQHTQTLWTNASKKKKKKKKSARGALSQWFIMAGNKLTQD